jgi:hypothetical protein
MDTHQAAAEPETIAGQQTEETQDYRAALHDLIGMGMDLARLVHRQVKSQAEATPDTAPDPELIIAFERISRAVRRSILLSRKLAEPIAPAAEHATQHRTAARRRIIRQVEDTIQCFGDAAEAPSLHADLRDRLDGPELDDDIDNRPVADIIADICRDFGLAALPGTHPWQRRTAENVATLCARAAAPRAAPAIPALARPHPDRQHANAPPSTPQPAPKPRSPSPSPREAPPGTPPPPLTIAADWLRSAPGPAPTPGHAAG